MLLAEAFIHPERLSTQDYAQALIGLNRLAGTGLVAVDVLRARTGETAKQIVGRFVGAYVGSFSVPARTAKDIYSAADPKEGVYRDVRQDPIAGPFLQNVPKLSQMFPESVSPYTTERMGKEYEMIAGVPKGIFRQLTGFYKNLKPPVKKEIDRIGLDYTKTYPRTGVPEADRKVIEYMAPIIERYAPGLIESKNYKGLTLPGQRLAMAELFKEARAEARRVLNVKHPDLALKVAWEGMCEDVQELYKQRGGVPPQ